MWDGTDAVMLSGEAATGKFPCEAVMAEASATREARPGRGRPGAVVSGQPGRAKGGGATRKVRTKC